MDIKTTPPEEYVQWLRGIGVAEADIPERVAHDMLRALSVQLSDVGVPPGFEQLSADIDAHLAADAVTRALR